MNIWSQLEKRYKIHYHLKDVILVSPRKAGRTWLRMMLAYVLERMGIKTYTHEMIFCCHLSPERIMEMFGKDIRILYLYRDPRDMVVSLYHERHDRQDRYNGNISQFIRGKYGIEKYVHFMNEWDYSLFKFVGHKNVRYEQLKSHNIIECMKEIINFLGLNVSEQIIKDAIKYASFNNMKRMEADEEVTLLHSYKGTFEKYNPRSNNEFRIRKGIVGGYKEELTEKDIEYVNSCCLKLNDVYKDYV